MIALVRTSGRRRTGSKGLSQVIVDLQRAGQSRCARSATWRATRTSPRWCSTTSLLPGDALVGEEGSGWKQVNAELAFERSGPERVLSSASCCSTNGRGWLREAGAMRGGGDTARAAGRAPGDAARDVASR